MEKINPIKLPSPDGLNSDLYGVNKRKIDIKTETRGSIGWGNFNIVLYNHTSTSTGNYSFTGAGFKPKYIEIQAVVNGSSTNSVIWYGYTDWSTSFSYFLFESGSAFISTPTTAQLIFFYNSTQNNDKRATLVSLDNDGFTVNFTRSIGSMNFIIKYYW